MIRYCFHLVIYESVDFSKLGGDSIYYDQNIVHNITKIVLFLLLSGKPFPHIKVKG